MDINSYLLDFLNTGGNVLWAILLVTIWLWFLIFERYWFFFREYKTQQQSNVKQWQQCADKSSWIATQYRRQLLSELDCMMARNLKLITGLIALLPMLGLLGTVTGMIQVFEVMAYLGSGNPRAMANGVSAATIPTMAGMVISLLAIPFATELDRRYRREKRETASAMPTYS
ncbi:MotA/TolQ/ExbB proton channel family protein [Echinimonas agarilytica]|uniref:MotA/TolQ/ExbB proton channel family protein n=1 Tax=Echinimonas agarilytica TaxID=1215918 RepID=A0AA42B7Y2_9GAMM|nr:MotA/TolQ/ExbB proton channel family protein [Echinimonas agarilytica]MCM2680229.1 MotA/TolQ/ExbB proton channel family protein [Echinimonas agarilytica]